MASISEKPGFVEQIAKEVKNSIGQDYADHSKRDEVGIGPYDIKYLGDYIMKQVGAQLKEITKLVEQNMICCSHVLST